MPVPPFEMTVPPGFEIIEEPSQFRGGRGALYGALVRDVRNREGVVLARQTRGGAVRSMLIFGEEAPELSDFLHARFSAR